MSGGFQAAEFTRAGFSEKAKVRDGEDAIASMRDACAP